MRPKQVWVAGLGGDPGASSSAGGSLTDPGLNVKASSAISEADHGVPKLGVLGTTPMVVEEVLTGLAAGGTGLGTTQTALKSLGAARGAVCVGEGPETLSFSINAPASEWSIPGLDGAATMGFGTGLGTPQKSPMRLGFDEGSAANVGKVQGLRYKSTTTPVRIGSDTGVVFQSREVDIRL